MEEHLGKETVREHRASIELSGELPSDSAETKQRKRWCVMRQRRVTALLSLACSLAAAIGLYFALEQLLQAILCPGASDSAMAVASFCNCTSSKTAGVCPLQTIGSLLLAGLTALGPFVATLKFLIQYFTRVWPYLRRSQGDKLFEEARQSSGNVDLTESLGFMGKVQTEVQYLYDLLRTEKYHDQELGCMRPLRLCVMIDDLDRCPKEAIVKVLEAVILLLVDAPITCWLAIDSRVVVAAIEDYFGVRRGLRYEPHLCLHHPPHIIIPSNAQLPPLCVAGKLCV